MSFVKDKMKGWSEANPEEATDRTAARAHAKRVGQMIKTVSGLFTGENVERAAAVIVEQMDATMPVVVNGPQDVKDNKVISAGQTIEFVPDNKARLEASKFLTAMVEGLPVQRQLQVSADFKDLDAEKKAVLLGMDVMQEALDELGLGVPLLENETASE